MVDPPCRRRSASADPHRRRNASVGPVPQTSDEVVDPPRTTLDVVEVVGPRTSDEDGHQKRSSDAVGRRRRVTRDGALVVGSRIVEKRERRKDDEGCEGGERRCHRMVTGHTPLAGCWASLSVVLVRRSSMGRSAAPSPFLPRRRPASSRVDERTPPPLSLAPPSCSACSPPL